MSLDRRTALLSCLALSALPAPAAASWKNKFAENLRDDFLRHWKSTKEYSLEVIDAMPAEHFTFKPSPEQRTFAEQVVHFGRANVGYFSTFQKDGIAKPEPTESSDKAQVRAYVEKSSDFVTEVLQSLTEADFERRDLSFGNNRANHTAQEIFLRAYMHTAHHRGQVVVYLRIKGIEPPAWRFPAVGEAS